MKEDSELGTILDETSEGVEIDESTDPINMGEYNFGSNIIVKK